MRTYYMHTMDDRPAAVQRHDPGKPWLAYAGKSITAVQMCDSLQQLRKEQRQCFLAMSDEDQRNRSLGYIRVRA
jgi:hypothetical protein